MDEKVVSLPKWTCVRCGHEWLPRQETRPRLCPNCRSAYWDKKRKRETARD